MPFTKVKEKFQVTIPTAIRKTAGLAVGDILEAAVKNKVIVLKPKTVVDRTAAIDAALAEGLEDIKQGRVSPAFSSATSAIRYLHRQAKKRDTDK